MMSLHRWASTPLSMNNDYICLKLSVLISVFKQNLFLTAILKSSLHIYPFYCLICSCKVEKIGAVNIFWSIPLCKIMSYMDTSLLSALKRCYLCELVFWGFTLTIGHLTLLNLDWNCWLIKRKGLSIGAMRASGWECTSIISLSLYFARSVIEWMISCIKYREDWPNGFL